MPIPARIKTGDLPSAPPPRGRIVAFVLDLTLMATGGYNRSADERPISASRILVFRWSSLTFSKHRVKIGHLLDICSSDGFTGLPHGGNFVLQTSEYHRIANQEKAIVRTN